MKESGKPGHEIINLDNLDDLDDHILTQSLGYFHPLSTYQIFKYRKITR